MHRFYILSQDISRNKIMIKDAEQIHRIKDVLRKGPDDEIILFDGKGNEYVGIIKEIQSASMEITIKKKRSVSCGAKLKLTLACAIPKGKGMEGIIDKLTQLGAEKIIPMLTRRVIVSWDDQKKAKHLIRWNKIAQSASEQSGRTSLVRIDPVKDISEVLNNEKDYDLKLIPTLSGKRKSLKKILCKARPKKILILIGPEGDFTEDEVRLSKKRGCLPVTLGDSVLRVETAAVAVASFIKLYEDD